MSKDDPVGQVRPAPRQLWLNRENMEQARDNWRQAYLQTPGAVDNKEMWYVAWAAAIAAHAYLWEGRTEPSR